MIKNFLRFAVGDGSGDGSSYGADAIQIIIATALKALDAVRRG